MKFCANLSFMFGEAPGLLERYALAREAGFEAVESAFPFGYSVEQVRAAKEGAGIRQVLLNLRTGDLTKGEFGVTAVPGKEEEFRQNLAVTIEYAKALDIPKVHISAGKVETITPENWETFESNLKYAVGVLAKENLVGLIEPINHHSIPNYFMSSFDKAVELIQSINSPHLRLQLDVFHLQHLCGDLTHNIHRLMPYVGHVQIAQVPNRNEPDSPGEIDYRYILRFLEEAGYQDWVGLEYRPLGATKDGLKWIQDFGYTL